MNGQPREAPEVKPTPTQLENDLAALGHSVVNKDPDGSGPPPEPEPKGAKRQ